MNLKDSKNYYIIEEINELVKKNPEKLILYSEDLYHNQISALARASGGRRILMVAGPSASGKTTSAYKIKKEFENNNIDSKVISLDDFYKNRSTMPVIDGKINAEVIEALELDMIQETINTLLKTGKAYIPEYDFISGVRKDNACEISIEKNGVVIIEGIHALNENMRSSLPADEIFNIYVSPHSGFSLDGKVLLTKRQMRAVRRIVRDHWSRGSGAEQTLTVWPIVCQGEDLYIRPSSQYTDYHIDTTHPYEPCLMKDCCEKLLSEIEENSPQYQTSAVILSKLNKFASLDMKFLPSDSLLREFVG